MTVNQLDTISTCLKILRDLQAAGLPEPESSRVRRITLASLDAVIGLPVKNSGELGDELKPLENLRTRG